MGERGVMGERMIFSNGAPLELWTTPAEDRLSRVGRRLRPGHLWKPRLLEGGVESAGALKAPWLRSLVESFQARSQPGLNLVSTWSQPGPNPQPWPQTGLNLVSAWSQPGLNPQPWPQPGLNLVSTWSQPGLNRASTFNQGLNRASTRTVRSASASSMPPHEKLQAGLIR
eukprot:7182261-Pyramimonas_sp.AAC.1